MEKSWRFNYLSLTLIALGFLKFIVFDVRMPSSRDPLLSSDPLLALRASDSRLQPQSRATFPEEAMKATFPDVKADKVKILRSQERRSTDRRIYRATLEIIPGQEIVMGSKFRKVDPRSFYWENFYTRSTCTDIIPYDLKTLDLYAFSDAVKINGRSANEEAFLAVEVQSNRHCLYYQYQQY